MARELGEDETNLGLITWLKPTTRPELALKLKRRPRSGFGHGARERDRVSFSVFNRDSRLIPLVQ